MKKKAKRYQSGGVLRDRFGNPVRSGSGDVVRTGYPDRSYDEQASASMTESSDYSGRRARSPEPSSAEDSSMTSDYMPRSSFKMPDLGGEDSSETRKITDYIRTSPKEDSVSETIKQEVKAKPKPKLKTKTTTEIARKMGEGYMKAAEAAKKPENKESFAPRTAAEARTGKRDEQTKSGFGPKITFGTPEQLEKARKSYYSGFESKPVRTSADIRSGRGMKSGGKVSSASSRADGIAQRGKTRGRIC